MKWGWFYIENSPEYDPNREFFVFDVILSLFDENLLIDIEIMGRTLPTYRRALEMEIQNLKSLREGLKEEDRKHFDNIMLYARIHNDTGSLSARMFILEPAFLSILIEHDKDCQICSL